MPRLLALAVLVQLLGCPTFDIDLSEEAADAVRQQDLGTLPYHPLVMHLDLSILAYQSYSQTLVWPFDPYYEEPADEDARAALMESVRGWADEVGAEQLTSDPGAAAVRGPGRLTGLPDNPLHDPILYQYSRLHPWSDALTNPDGEWTEYRTPRELTGPIAEVQLCSRTLGGALGDVDVTSLPPLRDDADPGARDVLLAIEGGTGDKGEEGQPASWSLVAVVLLRFVGGDRYDVHVAFRGSRSGSGLRAVVGALSTEEAEGNPDWITDLGTRLVDAPDISTTGQVFRGNAASVASTAPQLFACLDAAAGELGAPEHIYVTGHSLGGANAQHLASAILRGDTWGPGGEGMPASVADWPWESLKLITYGSPRVGDEEWAEEMTTEDLDSQYWVQRRTSRWDAAAIGVTDLAVIPRLLDADRPAGYRVLIPTDPITSELIAGVKHVGQTVYLEVPTPEDAGALPDFEDHEPLEIRARMTDVLRDDRIPSEAWRYHAMEDLHPERVEEEAGTGAEYRRLADVVSAWYAERDQAFAGEEYEAGVEELLGLLD